MVPVQGDWFAVQVNRVANVDDVRRKRIGSRVCGRRVNRVVCLEVVCPDFLGELVDIVVVDSGVDYSVRDIPGFRQAGVLPPESSNALELVIRIYGCRYRVLVSKE